MVMKFFIRRYLDVNRQPLWKLESKLNLWNCVIHILFNAFPVITDSGRRCDDTCYVLLYLIVLIVMYIDVYSFCIQTLMLYLM